MRENLKKICRFIHMFCIFRTSGGYAFPCLDGNAWYVTGWGENALYVPDRGGNCVVDVQIQD